MEILTTKEVAHLLKLAENSVYKMRKEGRGPKWFKIEGSVRYEYAEILKWIDKSKEKVS